MLLSHRRKINNTTKPLIYRNDHLQGSRGTYRRFGKYGRKAYAIYAPPLYFLNKYAHWCAMRRIFKHHSTKGHTYFAIERQYIYANMQMKI